ncbi:MAG: hypothetical protein Q9171_002414 [Xanthocarpia ochracea]
MEIIGGVSGVVAIVAGVTKLSKKLNEIRDGYSSVALNIQLAAIQLATIRDALEDIAAWRLKVQSETKAAKKLDAALADSLKGCAVLITVIDSKLGEAGYAPGLKGKIRHLWLEDVLKGYISNLDGQVRALQLLLTSNQMSTLADVMHHLEKSDARAVFEQVRADTASLTVGNKDLEDAASVYSYAPSINFEMDEILMRHPAYKAAYGNRRPPLPSRPSQNQVGDQPPSPAEAKAHVFPRPQDGGVGRTTDRPSDLAKPTESVAQNKGAHRFQEGGRRAEESTTTISPSDTFSHFSPSLAPAPLAIQKATEGRSDQEEGDTSLFSDVEAFKGQLESAFDDKPQAETQHPDIQVYAPKSDGDSFDLDQMISMLPLASHFDISRKPRNHNQPSHRQSIGSGDDDKGITEAEESNSVSSIKHGRPSPSGPSGKDLPQQRRKAVGKTPVGTPGADIHAVEQRVENFEGLTVSRSGSRRRDGDGYLARTSSVRSLKRTPSTDSDLYTSSISDKKIDGAQNLKRPPSVESKLSAKSTSEIRSPDASVDEHDLEQVRISMSASDETASGYSAEDNNIEIPLAESSAVGDHALGSAEADTAPTSSDILQPKASRTAPAVLPPTQASHMGFPQYPDAPHVRPRSSTAQLPRASPPFRKPVPSNSLRRSELSSPDFVKYSDAEHHGLKIVLTPESDPKPRHMSIPAVAPPPPPPNRPPPPVPPNTSNLLATLSPTASLDITRRWSNESSPSRYMMTGGLASPIERDESINGTLSTVSSSDKSEAPTLSSAMTSATNTIATSQSQPPESVRSQAQNDLQKLQQQLSAAKSRGDSAAQKASLQQSMDIIKKAYLSHPAAKAIDMTQSGTSQAKPKASRTSLKPKKSVPLFTFVGRKSKQADLHEAAITGNNDALRSLLEDRVNVNVKSETGRMPLMEAATRSHLHCMQILKEFGADEFAFDNSGRNVLHMAVIAEQPKAVSWLIESYPPTAPDMPGKKSSRLAWATEAIAGSRSSKILREASDGEGSRPLHVAAKLGLVDMVSLLLDLGSDIEAKDNWGRSPLLDAAMLNRLEVVELLLNRGSDISAEDVEGMTALHWAAKSNHLGVLRALLSNGNVRYGKQGWFHDWYNKNGDLPIHSASRNGNVEPMKLLSCSRPMSELRTKNGETLLHIVALANHLPLAKELLRGNVDVNTWAKPHSYHLRAWPLDDIGYNTKALPLPYNIIPLHYACTRGYFEMTELLLENGALVNAAPDDDNHGMSPLMMGVESGNTNLVCLLLARGAKVNATVPATLFTALHFACKRGDLETTQELIRYGAKTTARAKDSRLPVELVQKVKDPKKKAALEQYLNELTRQRYAKVRAQMAEERRNATAALTPQPTPSPQPPQQIAYGYPPGTVLPGTALPTQLMDYNNDAFPEAPPAYTPGSNAPLNLSNRPGVNRPHYGFNENLRLAEIYREFNVKALKAVAARAVNRPEGDVSSIRKLAEGGFNRPFVFTMQDGLELLAHAISDNGAQKLRNRK